MLGVPCLTLRPNTERPVTITHGTNRLVRAARSPRASQAVLDRGPPSSCHVPPLWDGRQAYASPMFSCPGWRPGGAHPRRRGSSPRAETSASWCRAPHPSRPGHAASSRPSPTPQRRPLGERHARADHPGHQQRHRDGPPRPPGRRGAGVVRTRSSRSSSPSRRRSTSWLGRVGGGRQPSPHEIDAAHSSPRHGHPPPAANRQRPRCPRRGPGCLPSMAWRRTSACCPLGPRIRTWRSSGYAAGLWRTSANRRALAARVFFDLVVEPGDLAAAADRGATATMTRRHPGASDLRPGRDSRRSSRDGSRRRSRARP